MSYFYVLASYIILSVNASTIDRTQRYGDFSQTNRRLEDRWYEVPSKLSKKQLDRYDWQSNDKLLAPIPPKRHPDPFRSTFIMIGYTSSFTITIIRQVQDCLYGQNIIRYRHQVNNLIWDDKLAHEAEQWAMEQAIRNKGAAHSSMKDEDGNWFGELIYYNKGRDMKYCHDANYMFYQEYKTYDYNHPVNDGLTGHFIQMVWAGAVKLGVGIVYANDQTWIVARYTPAEHGTLSNNVFPPRQGSQVPSLSDLIPSNNAKPTVIKVNKTESNIKECVDANTFCDYWLNEAGYKCDDQTYAIAANCQLSCGLCKPTSAVDGGWSSWQLVSKCSVTCGEGFVTMERFCVQPVPSTKGKDCTGNNQETQWCNTHIICNIPKPTPRNRTTPHANPHFPTRECKNLTDAKQFTTCMDIKYKGINEEYAQWINNNCKK